MCVEFHKTLCVKNGRHYITPALRRHCRNIAISSQCYGFTQWRSVFTEGLRVAVMERLTARFLLRLPCGLAAQDADIAVVDVVVGGADAGDVGGDRELL